MNYTHLKNESKINKIYISNLYVGNLVFLELSYVTMVLSAELRTLTHRLVLSTLRLEK